MEDLPDTVFNEETAGVCRAPSIESVPPTLAETESHLAVDRIPTGPPNIASLAAVIARGLRLDSRDTGG